MTNLTDGERAFADSAAGHRHIAKAASEHRDREAHKGSAAQPFTGAMRDAAVRAGAASDARANLLRVADAASGSDAIARAARTTAAAMRTEEMRTSYQRKG